ncbi:RNA-directed DNA polymerase, eukaryota [Tanacetum coccineum]
MGDSEWKEVPRKNRRSVFERLKPSHTLKSNTDDLAKISMSVYVSNFPSHLTVRELWNICGKAGTLVDVFIASRKNRLGQMYAFCRYIKVSSTDSLIDSLSKIWIGKLRLHANVARFSRNKGGSTPSTRVNVATPAVNNFRPPPSNVATSYANIAKTSIGVGKRCTSVMVEKCGDHDSVINVQECNLTDFPLAILGCYNDFCSIANARTLCCCEGFMDVDIKYLGGLWVFFEFSNIITRDKFINHKGIVPWFSSLKPWHDDFVVEERLVWLEIEGVPLRAWHNDAFNSIGRKDSCNDEEDFIGSYNQDQMKDGEIKEEDVEVHVDIVGDSGGAHVDVDDNSNHIEQAHCDSRCDLEKSSSAKCPDVPLDSDPFGLESLINKKNCKAFESKPSETPEFPPGFGDLNKRRWVRDLCNSNKVNFLDIQETKMVYVDLWMLRQVWGNNHFDFASKSAMGMSGGTWIPNNTRILWIVIYAPQSLSGKITLWSSMANLIDKWDGILITMGDFNEVREAGRPDHRPILLKEHVVDFSPTPFRFFYSWLELEGFNNMVVDTWNNDGIVDANGLISLKKKLQNLKSVIREWISSHRSASFNIKKDHTSHLASIDVKIDQGCATGLDFLNRSESIRILGDIHRVEANDLAQKARIKWALEGDENSSFFYATLKKKRRQLAIKGILKDGEWIEDPNNIKSEFVTHFRNRFQSTSGHSPSIAGEMPNVRSPAQSKSLERKVTRE